VGGDVRAKRQIDDTIQWNRRSRCGTPSPIYSRSTVVFMGESIAAKLEPAVGGVNPSEHA
jgi:hypothetical protein